MSELDRSVLVADARRDRLEVAGDPHQGPNESAGYTDSGQGLDAPSDA